MSFAASELGEIDEDTQLTTPGLKLSDGLTRLHIGRVLGPLARGPSPTRLSLARTARLSVLVGATLTGQRQIPGCAGLI